MTINTEEIAEVTRHKRKQKPLI